MAAIPASHQHGSKECKCKLLPLALSANTAAEFGDLASLAHRLSSSKYRYSGRPVVKTPPSTSTSSSLTSTSLSSSTTSNIIGITNNTATPLHLAAQNGHAAITSYLLQNGFYPDTGLRRCSVTNTTSATNTTDATSTEEEEEQVMKRQKIPTPLHRACHSGALSSIQLLLENGSNDMAVDYSIGDEMTPLHKAVKGGRYLAVALLLEHFKKKSGDNGYVNGEGEREVGEERLNDWRYLIVALEARDKSNRTPLDLALELQSRGEEEVLSVRRWDSVAGGPADWDHCVQLLQDASCLYREVDTIGTGANLSPSRKLALGEDRSSSNRGVNDDDAIIVSPQNKNDYNASKFIPMCNCDDNEGGQCKTLIWETTFRSQLLQSTQALLKPKSKECRAKMKLIAPVCIKIMEDDYNSQQNVLKSSNQNSDNKMLGMESRIDNGPSTQNERTKNFSRGALGQPCQACNSNTINFFRSKTGQLVCRKCIKASRKRR